MEGEEGDKGKGKKERGEEGKIRERGKKERGGEREMKKECSYVFRPKFYVDIL